MVLFFCAREYQRNQHQSSNPEKDFVNMRKNVCSFHCGMLFLCIFLSCHGTQASLYIRAQNLYGLNIVPTVWNDEVGIAFCWFNELVVHRFQYLLISINDHLRGAPSLAHITFYEAYESLIGFGINKNLKVHHLT